MTFMRFKTVIICVLFCTLKREIISAQIPDTIESRWQKYINLDNYCRPFWKTDTIFDENVQPIKENGNISTKLLFKPRDILSVKSADYSKEFVRGKDWDFKNGQLIISPQSTIPFINKEDLVFKTIKPDFSMTGKIPGTYVLFTERPFFSGLQIVVTYKKEKGERWQGPVPSVSKTKLPGTLTKLKNKQNLKVVFYGNSIEAGYNASSRMNTPPFMPIWPELIIYDLRRYYGPQITFSNQSVPGKLAGWGLEEVKNRIIPENPDLVIIGFGMNDGSSKVPPDQFRQQISGIIENVVQKNPNAEFILIAPMLPNPDAVQNGIQASYKAELDKLARKGIIVADMTAVHSELLKHKYYQDMTGNNVNHPNDYLARWYAQFISGFMIKN